MRWKFNNTGLPIVASILLFVFGNFSEAYSQRGLNKFSDPEIRKIHDLTDQRDSLALLSYLRDSNLNYQGEALMCFASIQAPSLNDSIAVSLDSKMDGIRLVAAFALGQSYHPSAVPHIKDALDKDTVKLVRGMLFDALGKTGNLEDLRWLSQQVVDFQETEGQAQGILRFGMRGISLSEGNSKALEIMKAGTSTVGMIYSSYHVARYSDTVWLKANIAALEKLYREEKDPVVSANLISGIIKGHGKEAGSSIRIILDSDADYREKVNTMHAIDDQSWKDVSRLIFVAAGSQDPNLAVAAAETIEKNANEDDRRAILRAIKKVQNWRARALLLGKAMELTHNIKGKEGIEDQISGLYLNSFNTNEKAWLLKGLATKPDAYKFVEQQMFNTPPVIRTYAMETITLMIKNKEYNGVKEKMALKGIDLDAEFLRIFKTAISSKDIALVSFAAGMIRDKELAYKEVIKDVSFMEQALEDAQSPDMIEAKNELISTLTYLTEKDYGGKSIPGYNHPIDWDRVMYTPPRQIVGIFTNKGDVIVQLNVNWCPGTVAAFLELVESGYYDNKAIHRVVPNFVVQDGCPRGDGWGGPPFTIRSEFTPSLFMEGTLGMASAGKDTEGSQWYFTQTATPHLDGKYTNFGSVVSGIDVVHKLEVGDIINKIEVIQGELR